MAVRHVKLERRGFTLVELLLGLAIGAIILAAVAGGLSGIIRAHRADEAYVLSIQGARLAMLRMTMSLRQCISCQVGNAAPPAATPAVTDTTVLQFEATPGQISSFRLKGTDLLLCPTESGTDSKGVVLARNVQSVSFTGEVDQATGQVYSVQIGLTIAPPSGTPGAMSFTTVESVALRRQLSLQ